MTSEITKLLKPFLASDYALLVVAIIILAIVVLYNSEKKLQKDLENQYKKNVSNKMSEMKKELTKVEPLTNQLVRVETRVDDLIKNMTNHKEAMGNASKAIAGEFLKLSQSTSNSISEIKDISEQVRFDFINSQSDMKLIAGKLEMILKDLEKRYGRILKIQDQVRETYGRVIKLEENGDWKKQAIVENREAIVNVKMVLKHFKERIDSKG